MHARTPYTLWRKHIATQELKLGILQLLDTHILRLAHTQRQHFRIALRLLKILGAMVALL